MKKMVIALVLATALGLGALPMWNRMQFAVGNLENLKEISLRAPIVRFGGYAREHMQDTFEEYSTQYEWNVAIQKDPQSQQYDTDVMIYFGPTMLAEIPGAPEICGKECEVEPDTDLLISTITELGLFSRNHKIVFLNLDPLEIDGDVEGERFDCIMERIYLEAKYIKVAEDPCEGLYTSKKNKRVSRSAVDINLIP